MKKAIKQQLCRPTTWLLLIISVLLGINYKYEGFIYFAIIWGWGFLNYVEGLAVQSNADRENEKLKNISRMNYGDDGVGLTGDEISKLL